MAQDNKQPFLNFLVTAFVLIGVILVIATLISGVTDQGNTTSIGRPAITRAFSNEFMATLPPATKPAPTSTPTPIPTSRTVLPTPED